MGDEHHFSLRVGRTLDDAQVKFLSTCKSSREWIHQAVKSLKEGGFSFIVIPLLKGQIASLPSSLLSVQNYFELLPFVSINSDLGITPNEALEWATKIVIQIPSSVLNLKAVSCIISFLEHLNVAGILITKVTEEYTTNIVELVNCTRLKTFIQVKGDWLLWRSIYSKILKSSASLVLEFDDLLKGPLEDFERWIGEEVGLITLQSNDFILNRNGFPVLPKKSQLLMQNIMRRNIPLLSSCCSQQEGLHHSNEDYFKYLKYLNQNLSPLNRHLEEVAPLHTFEDILQIPLQPLADNLSSDTYYVFEGDPIKYELYQKAIENALIHTNHDATVVMIVGAGRGPLVDCVLSASKITGVNIGKLLAIEKNPNAYVTLLERNQLDWNGEVEVIFGDVRFKGLNCKCDIIISELLGSFGDNELAPECIDGVVNLLKDDDGIMIPSNSVGFLVPVTYSKFQRLLELTFAEREIPSQTPYVVYTRSAFPLAECQPAFSFDYYTRLNSHSDRTILLEFEITRSGILDGFMGYFKSTLHDNVLLSTCPTDHTPNMASWFPIFFPCKMTEEGSSSLPLLRPGDKISLEMRRCSDSIGIWYQWRLLPDGYWYNENGISYKIGLKV